LSLKKVRIVCFLFTFLVSTIYGQEIHFTNISNSLNLPSQECYNVIQDSRGFIWIATENGLVKYSKDERKVFDKLNGLDENGVYYIGENKFGEIELLTANNRLLIIKNDSVTEHHLSKAFQNIIKKKSAPNSFNISYLLNRKLNGDLIINSQQKTFSISNTTSEIVDITKSNTLKSDANFIIDKNNYQDYFIKNLNPFVDQLYKKNYQVKIDVIYDTLKKRINIQLNKESIIDWRMRICNMSGFTFFALHDNLIKIDKDLNIEYFSFPSVITSINLTKENGLWIGTSSYGVYHYKDIYDMSKVNVGLKGLTVSSILVDKEGGTWCTTTEKGVYYSGNYTVLHYPQLTELNKKTTLLKAVGNRIFVSTEIDKLCFFEKDKIYQATLLGTGNADITDILQFKNKKYFATKGYVGLLNNNFQIIENISHNINFSNKTKGNVTAYQLDTSSNYLYALGTNIIYKLKGKFFENIGPYLKSKGRCFKVCNDSVVYVGGNDGLYKLNLVSNTQRKIETINTAVSKIIKASNGKIYFTTKGQGLFKLENDVAYTIELDDNSYILNDIIEDANKHLWISANDGLIELKIKNGKYYVEKYNTSNGLVSNNIGQLTINNNYLYVSSPDGICKFPVNENLLNESPPAIYVNEFRINDKPINNSDIYKLIDLKYYENTLTITLDELTFKRGKKESVLYKLNGLKNDYKVTNVNKLTFENLPPNNYELIIYAVNNDGIKSSKPIVIKFVIHPPFWFTPWFIFGVVILILLIGYFITRKIIINIRNKEEEKTRINKLISESQLNALKSQMNPHFIFNAINSIQNYVLNKKEDEAYNYLAKFSKLIRMVLNNSRENILTLQVELETLNLYIELEQLRFDNSFEYQLNINERIDLFDIEIPTMLIQPYVENAIWHGLMNLNNERKGTLKIDISIENNLLKVVIEDNGVGRDRSNEFKKESIYHSVAMKLTEERLEIINKIEKTENIKVIVSDLHNEEQHACGTRVELFLPLTN
jgi:ligand-binding sensor domain-containing protein